MNFAVNLLFAAYFLNHFMLTFFELMVVSPLYSKAAFSPKKPSEFLILLQFL